MMCGDCGERQSFNNIENRRRKGVEKMARWVNLVETNFGDPLREKEFNEWYDRMHLPDILETPGFVAARR